MPPVSNDRSSTDGSFCFPSRLMKNNKAKCKFFRQPGGSRGCVKLLGVACTASNVQNPFGRF